MSDLSKIEKLKLERFFGMESGYVMDFSNRTFREIILETTKLDIYADKYDYASDSKANRLRAFWDKENNYMVGKLTSELLEFWKAGRLMNFKEITKPEQDLLDECKKIATRLLQDSIVEEIGAIKEDPNDKDFTLLAKSIKESIEKNEPEAALDRLHTYSMKYVRQLCHNREIEEVKKEESLNALFGKYVKFIVNSGYIDSQMTERILKFSIHVIEAFNDIRNNKSFAHDNPILNYQESVLIFNNVTNSIKFIESVEEKIISDKRQQAIDTQNETVGREDLPF